MKVNPNEIREHYERASSRELLDELYRRIRSWIPVPKLLVDELDSRGWSVREMFQGGSHD